MAWPGTEVGCVDRAMASVGPDHQRRYDTLPNSVPALRADTYGMAEAGIAIEIIARTAAPWAGATFGIAAPGTPRRHRAVMGVVACRGPRSAKRLPG